MTAVGADLHLMGQLAGKAAVATLPERHGAAVETAGDRRHRAAARPAGRHHST
jgi:hypothetical protein